MAQKALLVLLSTTACLQAAADPSSPPQTHLAPPEEDEVPMPMEQFDDLEEDQVLVEGYDDPQDEDHAAEDDGVEAAYAIQYGQCYYFTNPEGEHLGSNGNTYSWLQFGSNNYRRPFKLCKDRHDCSRNGPLHHRGTFYLLDYQGSRTAKGKNIIAGRYNRPMFPSFRGYTNYIRFVAYNDCNIGHDADCYARLGVTDQERGYNGLEVNRKKYPVLSRNEQHTISVKFNRIQCPDHYDLDAEL